MRSEQTPAGSSEPRPTKLMSLTHLTAHGTPGLSMSHLLTDELSPPCQVLSFLGISAPGTRSTLQLPVLVPPGTKSWAPATPERSTPVCRLGSGETHRSRAYNYTRDTQAHRLHEKTHSTCVHSHMKMHVIRETELSQTQIVTDCVHRHTITYTCVLDPWLPPSLSTEMGYRQPFCTPTIPTSCPQCWSRQHHSGFPGIYGCLAIGLCHAPWTPHCNDS